MLQRTSVFSTAFLSVSEGFNKAGTTASQTLYNTFTEGSLMVVPPIQCNRDGSATFTIIGPETDIQAAIPNVPEGIAVDAVGGQKVAADSIIRQLSDRQREAIETALELGLQCST